MTKKNFRLGVLFSIINAISLGSLGIIDKIGATHHTSSLLFSIQSVSFGLLFATIFALIYKKTAFIHEFKRVSKRSWLYIFLVGIFASGFFIIFRFIGLTQSTGTFATLSQIIITALTAILATIFLKEKLPRIFWPLFITIIIAMYFVSIGKFTLTALHQGDIYILIGAVFVAAANIFAKLALQRVTPVLLSVGRFFFGAFLLLTSSIFFFHSNENILTFSIWSLLSGLFWTVNVIAFNFAVARIGVIFTTSILMIGPVFTMLLEFLLLKQNFNPIQIIAAIIVIVCGLLIMLSKGK